MLFKAEITDKVLKDKDLLCEQLYIFLNDYIPTRLIYESDDERQDCIQDTIMYMLDRYDQLDKDKIDSMNMEKFFYNRARSRVSYYIRKLKADRALIKKIRTQTKFMQELNESIEDEYIDYSLLEKVIGKFRLNSKRLELIKKYSINKLVRLGYKDVLREIDEEEIEEYDANGVLNTLSCSVVDEYLVNAAEDRGEDYR